MGLTQIDAISVAILIIYLPLLFIAILLAYRHGFGRNAGWLYLVLFSFVRILGSSLELATISSTPETPNVSLKAAAATLRVHRPQSLVTDHAGSAIKGLWHRGAV